MEPENQEPENQEPTEQETAEPLPEEVRLLLKVLDDQIVLSRRSRRSIERDLGMGQGYLGSLLNGRITLKVAHIWRLGAALGIEPLLLFYRAAPVEHQTEFLRRFGITLEKGADPERPIPPMTREEVEQLAKDYLREELGDGAWLRKRWKER